LRAEFSALHSADGSGLFAPPARHRDGHFRHLDSHRKDLVYRKQVRRRRAVLVALIVISLVLISSQFSEADSGPLHTVQRGVATVFSPIGEVAERALKPARDLVNWFGDTYRAKGENSDLKAEVAKLRAQVTASEDAADQNEQFRSMLKLDRSVPTLAQYELVAGRVIGRSPTVWYSDVTIDKGSSSGIQRNDAVVDGDGLVGRVTDTTSGTARVELIVDPDNAVSAQVLPSGPTGIVEPEVGNPNDLLLDFIDSSETIQPNLLVATAGWSDTTSGISSAYPEGIPIGRITSTESSQQGQLQRVHIEPFVDMRDLDYVQVLTGGPDRPGVPG
jgi:rod shape-determining protein MreC